MDIHNNSEQVFNFKCSCFDVEMSAFFIILVSIFFITWMDHAKAQAGSHTDLEPLHNPAFVSKYKSKSEWWDNQIGMEPIVLPGYMPVKTERTKVQLYGREYKWSSDYLPTQTTSRRKLMTGAMKLVVKISDRRVHLKPTAINTVESQADHARIVATGTPIDGLSVESETRVEYDGVAMSTITLTPSRPIDVDGLTYEVEIEDTPSMQVIAYKADTIRPQKDREDLVPLPHKGEFLNVIGFADGNRSFWWFADNAKGWIWNGDAVTEITRANGKLKLVQHLIGNRWKIDKPMTFSVNFLVTPVRDMGTQWRAERILWGVPSDYQKKLGGKFKLWWPNGFSYDAFPYTTLPKQMEKVMKKKDLDAYPGLAHNAKLLHESRDQFGIHLIPYFSAHVLSELDPTVTKFRSQWEILPRKIFKDGLNPYSNRYDKPVLTHRARSYSNYVLYRISKEIDNLGMSGIYLDHGPPHDSNNPANGGWVDSNGHLRGSLDVLGLREFLKRLKTLFHLKRKDGYVFVHNSNREIIPAYTFVTATVDGEQYKYSPKHNKIVKDGDHIGLLTLAEVRTRFAPAQYGVLNIWLAQERAAHIGDKSWQNSEHQRRSYRNMMTLVLLHDIPDWPQGSHRAEREKLIAKLDDFGVNRAEFVGYWQHQKKILVNDPEVKVSYYQRSDSKSLLAVIANLSSDLKNVGLTFSPKDIGMRSLVRITDGTRKRMAVSNNTTTVAIPPKDFRLIRIDYL